MSFNHSVAEKVQSLARRQSEPVPCGDKQRLLRGRHDFQTCAGAKRLCLAQRVYLLFHILGGSLFSPFSSVGLVLNSILLI